MCIRDSAPTVLTDGVRDPSFVEKVTLVQLSQSNSSAAIVPMVDVMHAVAMGDDGTPLQPFEVGKDGLKGNVTVKLEMQRKLLSEEPTRVLRSAIVTRVRIKDSNPKHDCFQFSLPAVAIRGDKAQSCLLYTSPSPRDRTRSRMPSSA